MEVQQESVKRFLRLYADNLVLIERMDDCSERDALIQWVEKIADPLLEELREDGYDV